MQKIVKNISRKASIILFNTEKKAYKFCKRLIFFLVSSISKYVTKHFHLSFTVESKIKSMKCVINVTTIFLFLYAHFQIILISRNILFHNIILFHIISFY